MAIQRGDGYSKGAIAFHWVIAVLVLFNLWLGLFHDALPREWRVIPLHKTLGILILVLSVARLGWRLAHTPPALPDAMRGWERAAAKAMHWALYALMIILSMSGWAMSSDPERPRAVSMFGLFDMPLLPVGHGAAEAAHEAHELLGFLMAGLVVLHIAAALRHHFLLRDDVLARMIPGLRRRG
ncbi:cytochrome b [Sphingomonas canadensis]|uniref:Cytochrome b n=1 Tax=Sphingomonas canadensis TaxID=1219257 RepID=A0ABW3HBK8_9SPHN|nr:cytochrome b [Sphingomonas canadensis]MCW3836382.1 cytochrome b [Sphingomonas canadensis]